MGRKRKVDKVLPTPPPKLLTKIPKNLTPEVSRYIAEMPKHPYPFAAHMPELPPLMYDPVKEIGANVAQVILQICAGILMGFAVAHYLQNVGH